MPAKATPAAHGGGRAAWQNSIGPPGTPPLVEHRRGRSPHGQWWSDIGSGKGKWDHASHVDIASTVGNGKGGDQSLGFIASSGKGSADGGEARGDGSEHGRCSVYKLCVRGVPRSVELSINLIFSWIHDGLSYLHPVVRNSVQQEKFNPEYVDTTWNNNACNGEGTGLSTCQCKGEGVPLRECFGVAVDS